MTNYQPQVVNDPLSGVAVTTLQPCNTYESQMRRTAGCSLWQRFVNWWNSRCRCIGSPSMSHAMTTCTPSNEWVVTSSESTASPYYAPSTNGRLVPVPSGASPTAPVPADRPPQLDPLPQRPRGQGAASRLSPPDTEAFVRTLDGPHPSLELGPPLVAPGSRDAKVADDLDRAPQLLDANQEDQTASVGETSLELVPVSWSIPTPSHERKLPTNEVWDDTGWQSER